MKSNANKVMLRAYDEIFETDESRAEKSLSKIRDIPLSEIDDFPDHPFKVRDDDDDMIQLVESIKNRGIITPVTLRLKEDTESLCGKRYELISGHRRKRACEIAGFDTLKAEIKEIDRDEAVILMVDSNLQRSTILPSERAFSYKMRLEAMKRQAGRPNENNYSPVGNNLQGVKSSNVLAEELGESKNQIFRYIRLTELIPEILEMVDERKIAFRPAVELSYLADKEQYSLLDTMECEDCTPSLAQAIKMKEFSKNGKLNDDVILSIMSEQKPNQKEQFKIPRDSLNKYFPVGTPVEKMTEVILKSLEEYQKRQKQRNMGDR